MNLVCEAAGPVGLGKERGEEAAWEGEEGPHLGQRGPAGGASSPAGSHKVAGPKGGFWKLSEGPLPSACSPRGGQGLRSRGLWIPREPGDVGSRVGVGGPGGPGMTRGQSAMIFQFGWLNRVRAERGAEGTPCPAARAPSLEDNRGRGRCRPAGAGVCGAPAPARSEAAGQLGRDGARRRGCPGGQRGGGRSVPTCREEQARGYEGDRKCGDVLEERKKEKTNIYGGNELFFFIEPSAMHQRVFLSLYVKRLLRKNSIFVVMSSRLWGR